jgi:hypothetical protein
MLKMKVAKTVKKEKSMKVKLFIALMMLSGAAQAQYYNPYNDYSQPQNYGGHWYGQGYGNSYRYGNDNVTQEFQRKFEIQQQQQHQRAIEYQLRQINNTLQQQNSPFGHMNPFGGTYNRK